MAKDLTKIKPIINATEVARRLKLSQSYISRLLANKRKNIRRQQQIRELITAELSAMSSLAANDHKAQSKLIVSSDARKRQKMSTLK